MWQYSYPRQSLRLEATRRSQQRNQPPFFEACREPVRVGHLSQRQTRLRPELHCRRVARQAQREGLAVLLGQAGRALRKLMSASRVFSCEPEAVIEDGELSLLLKRIHLGCLRSGGLSREQPIKDLLGTAREQLGTILGQAEELVALYSRSLFQKVALSGQADLRQEPVTAVLDLAGAIKIEMTAAGELGNQSRLERLSFKLDRLEGWFPHWKEFIRGP